LILFDFAGHLASDRFRQTAPAPIVTHSSIPVRRPEGFLFAGHRCLSLFLSELGQQQASASSVSMSVSARSGAPWQRGQSGYTVRRILLGIIKDLLLRLLCHTD
jgi:hypothetical protein